MKNATDPRRFDAEEKECHDEFEMINRRHTLLQLPETKDDPEQGLGGHDVIRSCKSLDRIPTPATEFSPVGEFVGSPSKLAEDLDQELVATMTNMWNRQNLALPFSYFLLGFTSYFSGTPLEVYLVTSLNASPAQITIFSSLYVLPWGFKLFFGLLSDCVPIRGQRRKPYFFLGWSTFIISNFILAAMKAPGILAVTLLSFLQVLGAVFSDVMCDAMIVERSKLEPASQVGRMQAVAYSTRFCGDVMGAVLGAVVYNRDQFGWGMTISQILFVNGFAALALLGPSVWFLADNGHYSGVRSIKQQFNDLWMMVQLRSVYKPMAFVAAYNFCIGISNPAWDNFLLLGLHFTNWQMGIITIVGSVFAWLGVQLYRCFLCNYSWRMIYVVTTLLVVAFSVLQILLIFQVNHRIGISDLAFAVGDDSITYFIGAIQYLPSVKMYLRLCPDGAEGTSYAALTALSNVAAILGRTASSNVVHLWDVSNVALATGEWSGLWKLTVLTCALQPIGLVLVGLLPKSTEEQEELQKSDQRSRWGGAALAAFLIGAIVFVLVNSIVYMVIPDLD